MPANPILVKSFRNNLVENYFRGAFCMANDNGEIIQQAGDIEQLIFPHSAIKSMQALALYKSDAINMFKLSEKEIAIICASHFAENEHIKIVEDILQKIDCKTSDLQCGAHAPLGSKARKALFEKEQKPNNLHNACSGKHAGMLAVAKAINAPIKDYHLPSHPVQKLVKQSIEEIIPVKLNEKYIGTDGCSVPTYAAPLNSFAIGFARMSSGKDFPENIKDALQEILNSATDNPFLIGGTQSIDSDLMRAFAGRLMLKIGSDGIFCGVLRDSNIGFSLKIDDGSLEAAQVVIANILLKYSNPSAIEIEALNNYNIKILKNRRRLIVGELVGV
ncbi:MAG: asparaginase [Devosiaceae bacterium]|nr:asparaginase [Devosiaceae bacterium]